MDTEFKNIMSAYKQVLYDQSQSDGIMAELTNTLGKLVSYKNKNPGSMTLNTHKGKKEMQYYIPKGCSLFQRKSDKRWEARLRKNGQRIQVACRLDKQYVYKQLMKAYRETKPPKRVKPKKEKELTLFA